MFSSPPPPPLPNPQAEQAQGEACRRFEAVSARAKEELATLKERRAAAFQRSLAELAELELKHSRWAGG